MVSFHGVSLVDGVSFLHGEFDQLINEETLKRSIDLDLRVWLQWWRRVSGAGESETK